MKSMNDDVTGVSIERVLLVSDVTSIGVVDDVKAVTSFSHGDVINGRSKRCLKGDLPKNIDEGRTNVLSVA